MSEAGMDYETARRLEDRIDALIEEALTMKDEDFGAVNWGDITVVDIVEERSLLYPSQTAIVVKIEEADPSCRLAHWLSEQVSDEGFDIYVQAEW